LQNNQDVVTIDVPAVEVPELTEQEQSDGFANAKDERLLKSSKYVPQRLLNQVELPYEIFLPEYNELFLFFVSSKLTADYIVDLLESWWQSVKHRFSHI
jgi:Rhodopirellula transposase DDE domain